MSTRQSRFVFVDASVHIHARRDDLPGSSADTEADPLIANAWFRAYLGEKGAFALEHETRHVHQLMAYPALYIRAIREYSWTLACLADFRDRGDIEYDPAGGHRVVLDPASPEVQFITANYKATIASYPAGSTLGGQLVWGADPLLHEVGRTRYISESTLLEADALVVQYRVAVRRGFDGSFRSWARLQGANPTALNDIVTVICGMRHREPYERMMLTMLPALVWHAFHTSRPVTAFFNFLEALSAHSDLADLQSTDADMMFGLLGFIRSEPRFLERCPPLAHDEVQAAARLGMPTNERYVQFEEDTATWKALATAEPNYPLADAIDFRLEGRWPDPMDFVDPNPDIFDRMQAAYPASLYILRVAPGTAGGGFYRRWVPRVPWRGSDSTEYSGRLTLLEIAQTLLANVYVGVLPPESHFSGEVLPTCWHEDCPVHPTGLCRFWDAIPPNHTDCEYLQALPTVLNHVIDTTGATPRLRRVQHSKES